MSEPRAVRVERPPMVTLLAVTNLAVALALLVGPFLLAGAVRRTITFAPLLSFALLPAGLVAFVCGWGLWSLRPLGRHLQVGLACLGLLAFPLGTFMSVIVLVYLFKPRTRLLFSRKSPEELTDEQVALLAKPDSSGALVALLASGLFFSSCGLLAVALVVPKLFLGFNEGKVRKTMADIRSIGDGLEAFAEDHGSYPPMQNLDELSIMLEPGYLSPLPRRDAWDRPFEVRGDHAGYVIRSAGADGRFEPDPPGGETRGGGADIIFSNGTFVQYPAGEL